MDNVAKHIIFSGRVQGVGFRFTVHRIAMRYGLTGSVRNTGDGSVEMFAQGRGDDISGCLADIAESFAGYIKDTKIEEAAFNSRYTNFQITF